MKKFVIPDFEIWMLDVTTDIICTSGDSESNAPGYGPVIPIG